MPEERFSGDGGTNLATICFLPLFILVKFNFVEKGVLSYKVENVSVAPLGKWKTNIFFLFHCNKLENDRNLLLKKIGKKLS